MVYTMYYLLVRMHADGQQSVLIFLGFVICYHISTNETFFFFGPVSLITTKSKSWMIITGD